MLNIIKRITGHNRSGIYTSCRFINYGISFMHTQIKSCCTNKDGIIYIDKYSGEKINWNKLEKQRKEVITECKKGNIPQTCRGCINLEKNLWNDANIIKEIVVNNWDHCNCNCIYCVYASHGSFLQTKKQQSKYYNALEHIKWLYAHNKISKDAKIVFVGGDISINNEADEIVDLCIKKGIGRMFFHTSGIFYSKGIENAIKNAPFTLFDFSLDCGTRETYKRIKRIDAFDNVIENIKKYLNCSPRAVSAIIAKYIIINGINDNVIELEKWIELIKNIGIKFIKLELDLREFDIKIAGQIEIVKPQYYEMYKLYYELIKKYRLYDQTTPYTRQILKEGGLPKGYKDEI